MTYNNYIVKNHSSQNSLPKNHPPNNSLILKNCNFLYQKLDQPNKLNKSENSTSSKNSNINEEDYHISGYASIFDIIDNQNDIIEKGAFADLHNNLPIKLLWQHDPTKPIGLVTEAIEDEIGLKIKALINRDTIQGREAIALLEKNIINNLSIGFMIKHHFFNKEGIRVISKLDLKEISIVTFPANEKTNITLANKSLIKNNKYINNKDMNNITTAENLSANNLTNNSNSNKLVTKSFNSLAEDEGGMLLSSEKYSDIISNKPYYSPVRYLSGTSKTSNSVVDIIVEDGKFDSGWVGETDERNDTNNSKFKKITININELYAQVKVTSKLLDDSNFDIQKWITERLANSFIASENNAFINGDGDKKPYGILKNNEIEKIDVAENITAYDLLNMINSLDEAYLNNASFLMNRSSLSKIQSMQDENGRFIWQQSMSDPFKQTIFGIPVVCSSNMPEFAKNSLSIILGDFSAGYKIFDKNNINILQDPYSDKPFIKFYAVKRVGGNVINPNAFKIAKIISE